MYVMCLSVILHVVKVILSYKDWQISDEAQVYIAAVGTVP